MSESDCVACGINRVEHVVPMPPDRAILCLPCAMPDDERYHRKIMGEFDALDAVLSGMTSLSHSLSASIEQLPIVAEPEWPAAGYALVRGRGGLVGPPVWAEFSDHIGRQPLAWVHAVSDGPLFIMQRLTQVPCAPERVRAIRVWRRRFERGLREFVSAWIETEAEPRG